MESLKFKTRNGVNYGIWFSRNVQAVNAKECRGTNREKWRSSTFKFESRDVLDHNTSTTAVLSEQNFTCFADHWWPHREAAKTIRKSSLLAMDKGICNGDRKPANQVAPYSTELAASEETWRSGMGAQRGDWKNSSHHDKSKWKLSIKLYRLVLSAKRWEQIDHTVEEGTTRWDDFACMLKIAN